MAEPQRRLMSVEEFFAWQLDQEERYELVDGVPVPLRGMTGASNVHDAIVVTSSPFFGLNFAADRSGLRLPTRRCEPRSARCVGLM